MQMHKHPKEPRSSVRPEAPISAPQDASVAPIPVQVDQLEVVSAPVQAEQSEVTSLQGGQLEAAPLQMDQPEHHPLHHSYIWLSPLRALPYIFAGVLASGFSALRGISEMLGSSELAVPVAFVLVLVLTLLIAGIAVGYSALAYRYKWYEFGMSEFTYCSGILSKKRTHVPYQKVQSVNEKMSLLQRLVGVCSVTIDTAGGADNKALVLPYIEKSAAERIRRELFMRKNLMAQGLDPASVETHMRQMSAQMNADPSVMNGVPGAPIPPWELQAHQVRKAESNATSSTEGNVLDAPAFIADDFRGVFAKDVVDTGEVTCEYGLNNKELLLSALSGKTSFALALLLVVSSIASVVSGLVDVGLFSDESVVYEVAWEAMQDAIVHAGIITSLLFAGILLIIWLLSMVGSCLSFAGFRSRRRGDRIEVERGLITHMFTGMDVERIQSIHIHQTFFQRLLKCCSIAYGRVGAMEQQSDSSQASSIQDRIIVHPFLPLSRVDEVISGLTPEYADLPLADKRVDRKALRRGLTRRVVWQGLGFWLAATVVICWVLFSLFSSYEVYSELGIFGTRQVMFIVAGSVLVLAVVIAVFEAIGAVMWYRRSSFGWDRRGLTLVNGGFSIDTVTIPRVKIQSAAIRTNPLQRHAHVATVRVKTAAGIGSTRHRLIDVSEADAATWLAWARPHGGGIE